jgi:RNA polymerase sigma-70 factor (ECF subfamily)
METHGPAVYRFCRAFLNDPDLAEDAHQMTFVQAFEGLSRFRGESSFASWLFGIARHRCLDVAKSQRRRQRRFLATDQPPETAHPDPGPEAGLSLRARGKALGRCLAELAPQVRATVLLRYQQELSYAEIGSLRGEKAAALQMRVARALPVLRRCLETWGWKP